MCFKHVLITALIFTIFDINFVNCLENPVYFIEQGWSNQTHVGYIGHFKIPIKVEFQTWWVALVFPDPILSFEVWQGDFMKFNKERTVVYFKEKSYNSHNYPGSVLDQRYQADFRKKPNFDYKKKKGPRPYIVFRHKVYVPDEDFNDEHMMMEIDSDSIRLPWPVEDLPVPDAVTKAATTTLAPPTKGADSGPFWWVRTRYAKPTRSTTTMKRAATTTTSTVATTTEEPVLRLSCKVGRKLRIKNCKKQSLDLCYIPQCYERIEDEFEQVQCWKHHSICWCVDKFTGDKTSAIVKHKNRGELPCVTRKVTTDVPETTTRADNITQLARPPFVPSMTHDYDLVLEYSLRFFESQRSGVLPADNRVLWRRSAHEDDGGEFGHDLSGGYYVSGDYVKYNFPMAHAMTMLAWGFLEFPRAYEESEQVAHLKNALKWGADYFLRCHVSKYTLYGQVGSADIENSYWERPQNMKVNRPCYVITPTNAGSDLSGEVSAALSSTALVWIKTGSNKNDPFVKSLLKHAKDLLDFALKYQQVYSHSIRAAQNHYESKGYEDELVWASLWLHRATGERRYLTSGARMFSGYKFDGVQHEASWDNKIVTSQLLLSQLAPKKESRGYLEFVKEFCDYNLPGGGARYTDEGFLYINQWATSSYAGNHAFVCLVASKSDLLEDNLKMKYRKFAEDQVDYLLGKMGQSYFVGYGRKYPVKPHHRASSCNLTGRCGWEERGFSNKGENPFILIGALVGGPDETSQWSDDRANYTTNGVSINNNAGFQSAVAGLRSFQLEYEDWRQWKKRN